MAGFGGDLHPNVASGPPRECAGRSLTGAASRPARPGPLSWHSCRRHAGYRDRMPPTVFQIVTAVAAAVAVLISFSAVVVAVKALRAARRSAAASERSAAAAEGNAGIAARDEQRRAEQRHEDAGPQIETVLAVVQSTTAESASVELRVSGGPGPMAFDVRGAAPWVLGLIVPPTPGAAPARAWLSLKPGEVFEFDVALAADSPERSLVLPLHVDVRSQEDPPRTWTRPVFVPITVVPPPRAF